MKRQVLALITASAIVMGSCAKQDDNLNDTRAISFNGKITNLSATTNLGSTSTSWVTGDNIGLFMVGNGTTDIVENTSNRQYAYSGTQFSPVTGNEIYYPVSDSKVDFIAYYPYKVSNSLGTSVTLNTTDQRDQSQLDFLYAHATNGGVGFNKTSGVSVPLLFDHKLSRVIIKPVSGTGLNSSDANWKNMAVSIEGLYTTCNFDMSTGTLSSESNTATVIPFIRTEGVSYEAIVIPSQYALAGDVRFNFKIGADTYTLRSQANETFETGKEYTYTVVVNKIGVELGTVTINDWASVPRAGTAM